MKTDDAGGVGWTRTVAAIMSLVLGSHVAIGDGPTSNATDRSAVGATGGTAATGLIRRDGTRTRQTEQHSWCDISWVTSFAHENGVADCGVV
jgi:hypothetical protein